MKARISYGFLGLFTALVLIGLGFGASAQLRESSGEPLIWNGVMDAYRAYLDCPSFENAETLLKALPKDSPDETSGNGEQALKFIFSPDNYPILYEEAISGDRTAVEVHFRLLNVADGIYSESVEATLGTLARVYPRLFLELLSSYKNTEHIKTHGYPGGFVGLGHNTHPRAGIYLLEKRIEALEGVKDPRYDEIRENCIRRIREAIRRREPN